MSHIEQERDIEKKSEEFHEELPTIDLPENLSQLPDAPTADMIKRGYELLDQEKQRSNFAAASIGWRQVVHSIPYLLACIGQGYDSGANGIAGAMPSFLIKFGEPNPLNPKSLYVPSMWLSLWSSFLTLGMALGNGVCGLLVDRMGPRKTVMVTSTLMLIAVTLQVTAVNRVMLLMGKFLAGIPMGIFIVAASNFISESVDIRLRAPLSSSIQLSSILGLVFGLTTGYERLTVIDNGWGSFRLLFAMQYIFPGLSVLLLFVTADSPTFAVKRGRPEAAKKSLKKLHGHEDEETLRARLAVIQHIVAMEQQAHAHFGSIKWSELFSNSVDRKRTLTTVGVMMALPFGAASFIAQSLYFLSQLGIDFSLVFAISISLVALGAVVSLVSGYCLDLFGRRNIFVYGNILHLMVLIAIGGLGYASSHSAGWALALLINIAISTQNFAANAPAFTYANEISSFRLRAKTQALAISCQNIVLCVFTVITPYIFQNPGNLGAKTAFIFVGPQLLIIVFGFLYLPETKQRSAAEIDVLYENKVSPRRFAKTNVNELLG